MKRIQDTPLLTRTDQSLIIYFRMSGNFLSPRTHFKMWHYYDFIIMFLIMKSISYCSELFIKRKILKISFVPGAWEAC